MNLCSINRVSTTGDSTASTVYVTVLISASGSDGYNEPRDVSASTIDIDDTFRRVEQASREMRWLNSIRWACRVPLKPRCLRLRNTATINHQHRRALELRPLHPT